MMTFGLIALLVGFLVFVSLGRLQLRARLFLAISVAVGLVLALYLYLNHIGDQPAPGDRRVEPGEVSPGS